MQIKFDKIIMRNAGFTLVELLVSVALFSMVVAVASGGFIQALRTQRNLVALMAVNDSASLTLEQMAREMRTGFGFSTATDDSRIDFINAGNLPVFYELDANDKSVKRNAQKITADNVKVNNLKFYLGDDCPSLAMVNSPWTCPRRITVSFSVVSKEYGNLENFAVNLQTTVSARLSAK